MTIWYERAGEGEPVVLLPSSAADAGMWDGQWDALAARFQVIRVDYRGFGHTPYQADRPYSDAGDVAEVLAELGVERAALVASSYGCRVALQLAGLATRLVLMNPGSGLPETEDVVAFGEEEDRLLEAGDVEGAAELNARTWLGPEADEATRRRVVEMQRHAFAGQLAADPEPSQFSPEYDLDAIKVPALIVTGPYDLPYFRAGARHLAGRLADAELVELEWAGHLPALERPEEVTRLLLDYL
ncbi:alpha/beta fold hydrolase [Nonomuraea harbinensis]|uniref:Alpha/beta fold hydrolase n=1 Tax=Nonomuraea harbinensis TaxID=1286938 RepID=A0ABW1BY51_9ACTN|nr:alpha/beta hydrolase [Nonomuraea harbinensis]